MDPVAILVVDRAGIIRQWSSGAEQLFGYTDAEAIGKTLDLLVPEPYRDGHWAGFGAAMAANATKNDQPAALIPVLCRDGSVRRFASRLVLLRDAHGRAVGAVGVSVTDTSRPGAPPLPSL